MVKYYRKRSNRRRYKKKIPRAVSLWPRTKLVKFRTVTNWSGTSGAGGIVETPLKANSLNDPTGSISANLPLGLDQWAAMYQKYVVVGSKCLVRAHAGTVTGSLIYGISLLRSNSALSAFDYHLEQPLVRSKMLTADVDHSGIGLTYSAKKFWKFRKFMDTEDQHASFSASPGDPTNICYYVLWYQDVGKSEAVNVEGVLTMEFSVLLFDPIIPSRSSL